MLRRKVIISLAVAAIMSIGAVSAYAATAETRISSTAGKPDMSNAQMATPEKGEAIQNKGDYDGLTTSVALAPVYDVDFDFTDAQEGEIKVVEGVVPQIIGETGVTSVAPALKSVNGDLDFTNAQKGEIKVIDGVVPQINGRY